MSSNLTHGQQALLKAELEARLLALTGQLAAHLHGQSRVERAREVLQQDGDDAPQRAPERAVAAALSEHERRELDAVSAALDRIAAGRYGHCSDCDGTVPFDRLKVEPWALRCLPCATEHEHQAH
ncbi:MAG: TraR/DksA family transcriptional regulator [Rubrivivax sp.]|nr:TraR/DksA family transcriptional regulator [Rubrivivax sp.]